MIKIIVNPMAGQGRTLTLWRDIESRIKELGIDYSWVFTKGVGDGTQLANIAVREGFDKIFIVGGDGTLNEVINGIDLNQTTIGIIPTGSGNDLAKMIGIMTIADGLLSLEHQNRKRIDLGRAQGRLFANNFGVGFDAKVAATQKRFKMFRGNSGYFLSTLKTLCDFRATDMEVITEEDRFCEKVMTVSVGNGRFHGGCFKLTPEALIHDGLLDICIIKKVNKVKLLFDIPKAMRGTHKGQKEVKYFKARSFNLRLQEPLFVHFDGEVLLEPLKEIKIEVLPLSLEVFVPV